MDKQVFISHRSIDKSFADIIETFLVKCGFESDKIFCSSLPGNDIKQGISNEIKNALKTSEVDIVILSDSYYDSPYCQNELGAIWYKDISVKIPICLPEIDEYTMQGFLNSEYKIRRLDNNKDIYTICDTIRPYCPSFLSSTAKLDDYIDHLMCDYKNKLETRLPTKMPQEHTITSNNIECRILADDFTDGELLLLKYYYSAQKNIIYADDEKLNTWGISMGYKGISVSVDVLVEEGLIEEIIDTEYIVKNCYEIERTEPNYAYRLKASVFRELRKISKTCIEYIDQKLKKYQANSLIDSGNAIDQLIFNGFSDEEILLVKYILDTESKKLMTGWQTRIEEEKINVWEELNNINDIVRKNYSKVITKFLVRKFIDISAVTSYNNPKEYEVKDRIYDLIKNISDSSKQHLKQIAAKHQRQKIGDLDILEESELPF